MRRPCSDARGLGNKTPMSPGWTGPGEEGQRMRPSLLPPDWGRALGPAGTFSHLVSLMATHGIGHSLASERNSTSSAVNGKALWPLCLLPACFKNSVCLGFDRLLGSGMEATSQHWRSRKTNRSHLSWGSGGAAPVCTACFQGSYSVRKVTPICLSNC